MRAGDSAGTVGWGEGEDLCGSIGFSGRKSLVDQSIKPKLHGTSTKNTNIPYPAMMAMFKVLNDVYLLQKFNYPRKGLFVDLVVHLEFD